VKIFWSWQNDYAPKRNRWFIQDALTDAVAALADEYELEPAGRPELDHDTKDTAGMVEITNEIFDKIAVSAAFVADLTPIARTEDGKALPNPNVLIELGWALKMPGWRRLVGVMNVAEGFSPDDLPFDIRQRRALTYSLPEGASPQTKKAVKASLVKALTVALRRNLEEHLDETNAQVRPEGVPANEEDPSIWVNAQMTVDYLDSLGANGRSSFALAPLPRAYFRLIPAGWANGIPLVTEIGSLDGSHAVQPPLNGVRDGDYGACEQGYVRCWFTGALDQEPREAGQVAMYFDETGEFWILDKNAIYANKENHFLSVNGLITGWGDALRTTNAAFDRMGANMTRRAEFGIVGLDGVRWPGEVLSMSPQARKGRFKFERIQRNWDIAAQHELLTEAVDQLRDIFGVGPTNPGQVAEIADKYQRR
tara:strand:- start:20493 stop:21761 length:1269 start_codon:yes stop_codon:yes gene_type:complete